MGPYLFDDEIEPKNTLRDGEREIGRGGRTSNENNSPFSFTRWGADI